MLSERNKVPFAGFGADMKQARKVLGFTQKSLAEAVGINTRYLANIENIGALPSLPVFYEIIRLCKLPVERYFHHEVEEQRDSAERERTTLKLGICPEKYLPIIEGTLDAAIKLDGAEGN